MLALLDSEPGHDFGRELIPAALTRYRVKPYIFSEYWADVGTIESFYEANVMLGRPAAPFRFYDPSYPIYTHLRHLPGSRFVECQIKDSIVVDGCYLDRCDVDESVIGLRSHIRSGTRIVRSVLLGADFYEDGNPPEGIPKLGIGRDVVLERAIVDKNARIGDGVQLINRSGLEHADGDGYFIRGGIIVVPKGAIIPAGTIV
jgi:glucose-1-phosphate adenylyltransferase